MAMELDNSFSVPVPPDQAWDWLLDVERIAPCMPGATVDGVDGDVVNGRIKIKVGPISLTYRGTAKFTERDPEAHAVVVEASGKETRGAGTASATIRAALAPEPSGNGTQVTMHTTMNVTGRPAQFGRGVMVEVAGKLVEQFASNLARQITGDTAAGQDGGAGGTTAADAAAGSQATAAGQATAGAATAGPDVSGPPASGAGADGLSAPGTGVDASGTGNGASARVGAAAGREAGTATGVPVATTTASPPAPSQEDSLNLVRLVGPAIAKRVVPIVVAAVGVTLLSRFFWRLRHPRAGTPRAGG
jgi:uncharacterized protein